MNLPPLQHPPGQIPSTAPQGLVDILWPEPASITQHLGAILTQQGRDHGVWWLAASVLLILAGLLVFRVWQDRHGIILRWRLQRLRRLLDRPQANRYTPAQLSAAAMWALARYFGMRPALQRPLLPTHWQPLVRQLDALRFGPDSADGAALQGLLCTMQTLSRLRRPEASC
ncbi:hypothetical protein A9404_08475 [Halothiobacillus diazotrophicus]|uniref:DUF4381 domain-containing protein n=1 Tax=Halothiobacillus diazotrophicus TaxID=1860122 RepID=A0A191ZHP4_9GAMM|nr:hypothetical protein [Halothiobacillus diazotrophicus]ANJ67411.1 hypothetical protein A9404_08475 [Halothiobacillus diazotrophicus]